MADPSQNQDCADCQHPYRLHAANGAWCIIANCPCKKFQNYTESGIMAGACSICHKWHGPRCPYASKKSK